MNSQQFKVGDWITRIEDNCSRQIISISENYYDVGQFIFDKDIFTYKLWQPKVGQWVCIESRNNTAYLQQWDKELEEALTTNWNIFGLRYEPFIGSLPTFLKDK